MAWIDELSELNITGFIEELTKVLLAIASKDVDISVPSGVWLTADDDPLILFVGFCSRLIIDDGSRIVCWAPVDDESVEWMLEVSLSISTLDDVRPLVS